MPFRPSSRLRLLAFLAIAPFFGASRSGATACDCTEGVQIPLVMRQYGYFAGVFRNQISVDGAAVAELEYRAGRIEPDPSRPGFYHATGFGCGEWDRSVRVQAAPGEVIAITTRWEEDATHSDYTEAGDPPPGWVGMNPTTVINWPSESCVKLFISFDGGVNYAPFDHGQAYAPGAVDTPYTVYMYFEYGAVEREEEGESEGPKAGVEPDVAPSFIVPDIAPRCGGSAATTTESATEAATLESGRGAPGTKSKSEVRPRLERDSGRRSGVRTMPDAYRHRAMTPIPAALKQRGRAGGVAARVGVPNVEAATLAGPLEPKGRATPFAASHSGRGLADSRDGAVATTGGSSTSSTSDLAASAVPGSLLQSRIGGLRMRMGLGHDTAALVYETPVIEPAAYRPATLRLSGGIHRPELVIRDPNGALRQLLTPTAAIDVVTISSGRFEIRYYRYNQVEPSTSGFEVVDDHPFCTWVVENPDENASNRVRFIQEREGEQATHLAAWTPASGSDQGRMTLSYFEGAIVEERTYFREASGAPFRGERIQRRRGAAGAVEHDVYEAYMEFYHWGEPGDVYEALVYRVEGPATAEPRVTEWTYADDGFLRGKFVTSVIYPDGYWERYIYAADGELRSTFSPWVDAPAHPSLVNASFTNCHHELVTYREGANPETQEWRMVEKWAPNTADLTRPILIGRSETLRDYGTSGGYREDTWTLLDPWEYARSAQIRERRGGALLLDARADNSSSRYVREWGFWIPESEAFSYTAQPGAQVAQRVVRYEGNWQNSFGVANQTLITSQVEDVAGRLLLQEVFVNDGAPFAPGLRSDWISREIYTYNAEGHLLTLVRNGAVVHENVYDERGRLQQSTDEAGLREVLSYDAFDRVQSRVRYEGALVPSRTFTYTYNANHDVLTETLTAGSGADQVSRVTTFEYDPAGRLTAQTAPDGLINRFQEVFLGDGQGHILRREVTHTRPDGAEVISEYHQDRRLFRRYGGVPTEYIGYAHATGSASFDNRSVIWGYPVSVSFSDYGVNHRSTTWINWAGDILREVRPGFAAQTSYLNMWYYDTEKGGRLGLTYHGVNTTGGVAIVGQAPRVFEYDAFGRLSREGLDYNFNWTLDAAGTDPMTITTQAYERGGSPEAWFKVTRIHQLQQDSATAQTLIGETREQLTGLPAKVVSLVEHWDGRQRVTSHVTLDRATATETISRRNHARDMEIAPDLQVRVGGRLASSRVGSADAATTYTYRADGSVAAVVDPKLGAVRYGYSPAGRLETVTDALERSTRYAYHPHGVAGAGLLARVTDAAGRETHYAYDERSRLWRQWGAATYPQEWGYDSDDRLVALRTFRTVDAPETGGLDWTNAEWPADAPAGDLTQWLYHASGLLARKVYADGSATAYTYDNIGRLRTRTNARLQVATYSYDSSRSGLLSGISYSAGSATPAVGILYNRSLQRREVADGSGTRTFTYSAAGALAGEQYTSGLLTGYGTERTYTGQQQLDELQVPGVYTTKWSYDALGRPNRVVGLSGTVSNLEVEYVREPGTDWMKHTIWRSGMEERLRTSREYDEAGRLSDLTTRNGTGDILQRFQYAGFDERDRRTRIEREDGTYWEYGYNARGELETARRGAPSAQGPAEQLFDYRYDSIGNRRRTSVGGRTEQYDSNALNQYRWRTVPGLITVSGAAAEDATVTADFRSTERAGEGFRAELAEDNVTAPVWKTFDVVAVRNDAGATGEDLVASVRRTAFVPQTPETFSYDADGNMTADGRWIYTWDVENRLVGCETTASAAAAGAPRQRLEFTYDSSGRRVSKRVSEWFISNATWSLQDEIRFLYDDWNLVAELSPTPTGLTVLRTHWWGLDLSGTRRGFGGVGGLVYSTDSTAGLLPTFDGDGNVCGYLSSDSDQFRLAGYDPTGAPMIGQIAGQFGFSTRYHDRESTLLNYGRRFYNPVIGRWLSRDPLGELTSLNRYLMLNNNAVGSVDVLGLYEVDVHRYLMEFEARSAGFRPDLAEALARQTQALDDPGDTRDAMHGGWSPDNMKAYHFPTPEQLNVLRERAMEACRCGQVDSPAMGEYFHAFQDTYAHTKGVTDRDWNYYSGGRFSVPNVYVPPVPLASAGGFVGGQKFYGIGHGHRGHEPDWTWRYPEKTMQMAEALYYELLEFAKICGGGGDVVPWERIQPVIEKFVRFEPNIKRQREYLYFVRNVTFDGYEAKVMLLDPEFRLDPLYRRVFH